ncbi:MAG TPA: hypothetical protein VKR58_08130, partial [Aquella sp.]|nr:hypothetical protein [Aquella sp.]
GEKAGKFCKIHKLKNMIDVKSKKCEFCDERGVWNFPGLQGKFCKNHADINSGMICLTYGLCEEDDCKLSAIYNYEGCPAKYCKKHKIDGMIYIYAKKCSGKNCELTPSFGYEEGKPLFCCY